MRLQRITKPTTHPTAPISHDVREVLEYVARWKIVTVSQVARRLYRDVGRAQTLAYRPIRIAIKEGLLAAEWIVAPRVRARPGHAPARARALRPTPRGWLATGRSLAEYPHRRGWSALDVELQLAWVGVDIHAARRGLQLLMPGPEARAQYKRLLAHPVGGTAALHDLDFGVMVDPTTIVRKLVFDARTCGPAVAKWSALGLDRTRPAELIVIAGRGVSMKQLMEKLRDVANQYHSSAEVLPAPFWWEFDALEGRDTTRRKTAKKAWNGRRKKPAPTRPTRSQELGLDPRW